MIRDALRAAVVVLTLLFIFADMDARDEQQLFSTTRDSQ